VDSRFDQKVALVHAWFRAFNERDYSAGAALFHSDVEYDPTGTLAPPGTSYTGHDGVTSLMRSIYGRYPDVMLELGKAEEVGRCVLATVVFTAEALPDGRDVVASLYEFDGELIRRVRSYYDVAAARLAAEDALHDEFRTIFESALEAIMLVDADGEIREMNDSAAELFGGGDGLADGRRFTDFLPADAAGAWERDWKTLRDHGQISAEAVVVSREGQQVAVDIRARAYYRPGLHLVLVGVRADERSHGHEPTILTPREREIFRMLALGFNAPEIADRLFLSPATVRTHVQNGVGRLGAKTRVQAVAMALTKGEISL
jgi:PAS domain S-box-containing protein